MLALPFALAFALALVLPFSSLIFAIWSTPSGFAKIRLKLLMRVDVREESPTTWRAVGEPPGHRQWFHSLQFAEFDEIFCNVLGGVGIRQEVIVAPSIDNRQWSLLRFDKLGNIDCKLTDVKEHSAMADKDFLMEVKKLVFFSRIAEGTIDQFGGHFELFPQDLGFGPLDGGADAAGQPKGSRCNRSTRSPKPLFLKDRTSFFAMSRKFP